MGVVVFILTWVHSPHWWRKGLYTPTPGSRVCFRAKFLPISTLSQLLFNDSSYQLQGSYIYEVSLQTTVLRHMGHGTVRGVSTFLPFLSPGCRRRNYIIVLSPKGSPGLLKNSRPWYRITGGIDQVSSPYYKQLDSTTKTPVDTPPVTITVGEDGE